MNRYKPTIAILLMVVMVFLTGCLSEEEISEYEKTKERFGDFQANNVRIVEDKDTGCKYLYVKDHASAVAVTPLYKSNGVVDCD